MPTPCEQKADIVAIKDTIATHNGQWKILLWGMGILTTVLIGFSVSMHNSQKVVSDAATKIDKTLSSYIAGAEQRNTNLERRIEQETQRVDDHERRIRVLENKR